MLLVPGVVALVTYRYTFLDVFATRLYAGPGAWPLAILVGGAIPFAFSQILLTSLDAIGRRRLELYITGAQVGVLILAIVVLMPPWGILPTQDGLISASVAVLFSGIAALVLNTYFVETLIRVHIDPKSIVRITISAALSFAALSLVNRTRVFPELFPLRPGTGLIAGLELLAAVFIGFFVYFVVLAVVGELTQEDVRRIGGSLSIPKGIYEPLSRICRVRTSPSLPPIDLRQAPGLRTMEFPEPFTGTTELPSFGAGGTPEEGTEEGRGPGNGGS